MEHTLKSKIFPSKYPRAKASVSSCLEPLDRDGQHLKKLFMKMAIFTAWEVGGITVLTSFYVLGSSTYKTPLLGPDSILSIML